MTKIIVSQPRNVNNPFMDSATPARPSALGHPQAPAIGIDVGGTSVKGGVVDLATGALVGAVVRRDPGPGRIGEVVPVIAAVAVPRARAGAARAPRGAARHRALRGRARRAPHDRREPP